MRIVIIPQYFYPTYGGLQHFTNRLCSQFISVGTEVTILSPPPESDRDIFLELRPNSQINWKIIGDSRQDFWLNLHSFIPRHTDAILFLSIEYEEYILQQLNCIQTCMSNSTRTFVRVAATNDYGNVIAKNPERQDIMKRLDGVLVPTEYMQTEIKNASNGQIIPTVIWNLIDYNKYYPVDQKTKSILRKKYNMPDGIIAVWAGRFDNTKNLKELLLAWKFSNSDGTLLLVGDDPYTNRSYKQELLNCININKIKNVKFFGHCLENNISEVYQSCDFYVCSSMKEGHSNASLEACACGLPIIAYDIPGVRETATSFPFILNRIVPALDFKALADAINLTCKKLKQSDNLCWQPYKKSQRHSPDVVTSRYISILSGKMLDDKIKK